MIWIWRNRVKFRKSEDLRQRNDRLNESIKQLKMDKEQNKFLKRLKRNNIENEELFIEQAKKEIELYGDYTKIILFMVALIVDILFFSALLLYLLSTTKIYDINDILDDIEKVSYSDDENNVVVIGKYCARINKRKVYYDLKIKVKNLNKKDISFARVIDNKSKEKFDISGLSSGNTYSQILVNNVNEKSEYDVQIKNVVFEE